MVCDTCLACLTDQATEVPINTPPELDYRGSPTLYNHHPDVESFRKAVQSSCRLCVQFQAEWDREEAQKKHRVEPDDGKHKPGCTLTRLMVVPSSGAYIITVNFTCMCRDGIRVNTFGIMNHLKHLPSGPVKAVASAGSSTGSPSAIGRVKSWAAICDQSHAQCKPPGGEARPPIRLLDVGSDSTVRLIVTAGHNFKPQYNTLSYKWLDDDSFLLRHDNFDEFKSGVATTRLRQVFQDAIRATQDMGVPYLWIDGLCIIQHRSGEPADDWTSESQQMDQIYSHAYCNLSATASSDAKDGMFRDRQPNAVGPWFVSLPTVDDYNKPSEFSMELIDENYWDRAITNSPLHKRGWVYQERFLARRVVHFTNAEVMWECAELQASESYPEGIPKGMFGLSPETRKGWKSNYLGDDWENWKPDPTRKRDRVYDLWLSTLR